jgi:hypothetical protein
MKKATLQVGESEKRRLSFAGLLMHHIGVLPDDVIAKFSRNEYRAEIPDRLLFGFTAEDTVPFVGVSNRFKVSDTNLKESITNAERFTKKILGIKVDIRKMFDLPTELLWKNVMVIYDPGFDNRNAVEKALEGQKLDVYQESDVMEYSGSSASNLPTLRIIENSLHPTEDTLGNNAKSPDQLNADGRNYLDLRGYGLAFGQRYFISKDFLDPETWTWFPKNRLPSGEVADGRWSPDDRQVEFYWNRPDFVSGHCGARLEIEVKLKT